MDPDTEMTPEEAALAHLITEPNVVAAVFSAPFAARTADDYFKAYDALREGGFTIRWVEPLSPTIVVLGLDEEDDMEAAAKCLIGVPGIVTVCSR